MTTDVLTEFNPKTDLIAIRFNGGTGGKFLSAWLTNAKLKFTKFNLLDNGSSKYAEREIEIDFERPANVEQHIEHVQTLKPKQITFSPYFYTTTTIQPSSLANYVSKLILLTYTNEDIDLIFRMYCNKNNNLGNQELTIESTDTLQKLNKIMYGLKYSRYLISLVTIKENMMCLSFRDLMFGDIETLITTLSEFTGIESNNFDVPTLVEWREKSLIGADSMTSQLKAFYEQTAK
jgi:hypothetical protein